MSPMQQMFLGLGAGAKKTYVDDVFSTYVYAGNSTARSINNGLDLSGEGGMVWIKSRDNAYDHYIVDTERGALNRIRSNSNGGSGSAAQTLTAFNNNGFALGADSINLVVNASNKTYASWSFRKAPGFFDVVTYTGNGSARTIAHSLESVPGCIMIKCTSTTGHWRVYHRALGEDGALVLNSTNAAMDDGDIFGTTPTSTNFYVGNDSHLNTNGETYVAYLFAGGESTASEAVSVTGFDRWRDMITDTADSDFAFGTGDFTVESWFRFNEDNVTMGLWTISSAANAGGNTAVDLQYDASAWRIAKSGGNYSDFDASISKGVWYHTAVVRESGVLKLYVNGALGTTLADTTDYSSDAKVGIGYDRGKTANGMHSGDISNFRVVKGTAVYTSSFRPPTTPLTNITNTKLLCCQNSTPVVSTVIPSGVTMTRNTTNITESSDSPFDDPAAFTFGDTEDQNIIKCGSYKGDGSPTAGPQIFLGWESSFILIKRTDSSANWELYDSMRGITTGVSDGNKILVPNTTAYEDKSSHRTDLTATGFVINDNNSVVNANNGTYIYMCIRRPDGYIGKPADAGTDVFAMDTGDSSSYIPNYDSNFPVDLGIYRSTAGTYDWYTASRLTGDKYLFTNTNGAEATYDKLVWDSNVGWSKDEHGSGVQSWMWKRHAGFDVVTYKGNENAGRRIAHSLGRTPEMMWLKYRSPSGYAEDWQVYHKGLNGGVDPQDYSLRLDTNGAEYNSANDWNDTAPTSTHFTIGSDGRNNRDGSLYITMLFASVDGISKVGYYSGSNSSQTISTGFAPRFLVMKKTDTAQGWVVLDTVRGWGSGGDERLEFHNTSAQNDNIDFGAPTSSGFTLVGNVEKSNQSGGSYIYYAHA